MKLLIVYKRFKNIYQMCMQNKVCNCIHRRQQAREALKRLTLLFVSRWSSLEGLKREVGYLLSFTFMDFSLNLHISYKALRALWGKLFIFHWLAIVFADQIIIFHYQSSYLFLIQNAWLFIRIRETLIFTTKSKFF